jgi:hypothetical protein
MQATSTAFEDTHPIRGFGFKMSHQFEPCSADIQSQSDLK